MPSLRILSIDSGISQCGTPDVVALLTNRDLNLVILDLNLNVEPPVAVPTILDIICPALTTFTFNADRRINPTGAVRNITDLILISQPSAFMGSPILLGSQSE
jgi:hypothetical protein